MPEDEKSKDAENSEDSELMTDLLRQMGLCEDEIGAALDLAESIEQKIETKTPSDSLSCAAEYKTLSTKDLIKLLEERDSQLHHFQNVVAVQLVLIIQKYKDKVILMEKKIQQKNAQIQQLSQELDKLRK